MLPADWGAGWPNVWLGTTVENQAEADRRIPHLLKVPAARRFLSCEPLLAPLDLASLKSWHPCCIPEYGGDGMELIPVLQSIDWVIVGGESSAHARPMHPDWARSLRDQCTAAGVPFHFKQWGEWAPSGDWYADHPVSLPLRTWAGDQWTDDGAADGEWVAKVGKKAAGRLLDGVEHNGFPSTPPGTR